MFSTWWQRRSSRSRPPAFVNKDFPAWKSASESSPLVLSSMLSPNGILPWSFSPILFFAEKIQFSNLKVCLSTFHSKKIHLVNKTTPFYKTPQKCTMYFESYFDKYILLTYSRLRCNDSFLKTMHITKWFLFLE